MKQMTRELFYLGKGGTGKTTLSALTAVALAERNFHVALISMDPAHNLFDIFKIHSSRDHFEIANNFQLEEIDTDFWIKKYLQSIEQQISQSYQYLTALSLEKNLQILRYSPGLEEYALLYAFHAIRDKFSRYDFLIIDMPPTALALRFFALPQLSDVWLEQLIAIRKNILKKKKIIDDIHQQDTNTVPDKILTKLIHLQEEHRALHKRFCDPIGSSMYIVLNDDELSLAESEDIYKKFNSSGLSVTGFILNKATGRAGHFENIDTFPRSLATRLNFSTKSLIGMDELRRFVSNPVFQAFITDLSHHK